MEPKPIHPRPVTAKGTGLDHIEATVFGARCVPAESCPPMGSAAALGTHGSTVAALRSEPGSLKPQGISPLGQTQKRTEPITLVQTVMLTLTFTITSAHTDPILVLT